MADIIFHIKHHASNFRTKLVLGELIKIPFFSLPVVFKPRYWIRTFTSAIESHTIHCITSPTVWLHLTM